MDIETAQRVDRQPGPTTGASDMSKIAEHQKATAAEAGTAGTRKSGRAVFSDDGRSVWEWQTSTGVFSQNISDEQLGLLEAPHLELVDSGDSAGKKDEWTQTSDRLRRTAVTVATMPKRAPVVQKGKLRRLLRLVAGTD